MYKVFINEKKLLISDAPQNSSKNIYFDGITSIEIAIDLLQNTSTKDLNLYNEDFTKLWKEFKNYFKIIEAAGGIVTNSSNEILFIKRLGKWDLPKGKVEIGETLENASVREVEEETGLTPLLIDSFLNTTYHVYIEKNGALVLKCTHWYAMKFDGIANLQPQIEEGITDVDWKNKTEINEVVFANTFQNIKLILTEFWGKLSIQ